MRASKNRNFVAGNSLVSSGNMKVSDLLSSKRANPKLTIERQSRDGFFSPEQNKASNKELEANEYDDRFRSAGPARQ